jgi:hypothetical protein
MSDTTAAVKAMDLTVKSATAVKLAAGASVREAAEAAAELFGPTEIEKHAQVIADAWKARLLDQSKTYVKQLSMLTRAAQTNGNGEAPEAAEPVSFFFGIPYQWWNLILAGPFQAVAPLGPFQPQKIIRHGEPAFLLAAFWRNPAPLPGGPNPSAAQIMAPYTCQLRIETINLSAVTNGPDFVPPAFVFGGGNVNIVAVPLPTGAFSAPSQGNPQLYEVNATSDIIGPGSGLPPFAGFATTVLDPDSEFPFLFPVIPGLGPVFIPGVGPRLQHDEALRFLRYA